jgi:ubiquinone/menaquinone biosynthesis C-methylase UbiE
VAELDRRLVALYDDDNPDGPDSDYYRALVAASAARSVIDLGCGTGMLTVSLVESGRSVVGVDPSATMIEYARKRRGADGVKWIRGDSRSLRPDSSDFALMTGNVAQHIPDDDWERTLEDLHRALWEGGTLAFESRNPAVEAWRSWSTPEHATRETPSGPLEEWSEAQEIAPGVVRLIAHNRFTATGELLTYTEDLFFREQSKLEYQLTEAGFDTTAIYGDWQHGPVTDASAALVLVATAR